jgi:hypothetical protein
MVQTALVVSEIYNVTRQLFNLSKSSAKYMNQKPWRQKNRKLQFLCSIMLQI